MNYVNVNSVENNLRPNLLFSGHSSGEARSSFSMLSKSSIGSFSDASEEPIKEQGFIHLMNLFLDF